MGKRAVNQASGMGANKKTKADSALASVADVIKQAEHLPDSCRSMLVDMLPFCLTVSPDERLQGQTWAVGAVEETLKGHKSLLEAAIVTENGKLSSLNSLEVELVNSLTEAESALVSALRARLSAKGSLAEANEAANTASSMLLMAQTDQKAAETKLASTTEEKATFEASFQAHFKTPMEGGAAPNFQELQPLLKNIEMEASLLSTLPLSCSKTKDERGSFDEVVLQEFEKAMCLRIASLGEIVVVETAALAEHGASVDVVEKQHNEKKEGQKQAADAFECAQKEQSNREATLAGAKQAAEQSQSQVNEVTGLLEKANAALETFETGPLHSFTKYKTLVGVSDKAAPAGA